MTSPTGSDDPDIARNRAQQSALVLVIIFSGILVGVFVERWVGVALTAVGVALGLYFAAHRDQP